LMIAEIMTITTDRGTRVAGQMSGNHCADNS